MDSNEVRLSITGTRALLLHNRQVGEPSRQVRPCDEADQRQQEPRRRTRIGWSWRVWSFQGSLYWDDAEGPVIPTNNVFAALVKAANELGTGRRSSAVCSRSGT